MIAGSEHRAYPPPTARPVMAQRWHDLLFAHWPVPVAMLRSRIPAGLAIDTFEGQAWVGVVPFWMSGVRLRPLPAVPGTSRFPELNVRTYVTDGTEPGVWFFCLDAGNPLAVAIARAWYHLPYFNARMRVRAVGDTIRYDSRRTDRRGKPARFVATYRPKAAVALSTPGSLEAFLTERYCLYTADARGRVFRGEIHHRQWPLQPAEARIEVNTMAAAHGIMLPDTPPLLHYARRLDIVAWSIRELEGLNREDAKNAKEEKG